MKSLLTLFTILFSTVLFATEIPEEKSTALNELFKVMGIEEQMLGGFEAMLPVVDQLAAQLQLNADEKEELKNVYRDWFVQDIDREAILSQILALYADTFTLEDIQTLQEFHLSPIGQKFLKESPELMKKSAQIGMTEAQKAQGKLMERLGPFMEKHSPQPPSQ